MRTRTLTALALGYAVLAMGCRLGRSSADAPSISKVVLTNGTEVSRAEGTTDGALWAAIRPDHAWNRDLVVLLHGAVSSREPLSLDPPLHWFFKPFQDTLLARGYGVAFSSYRVNGDAARVGALDSRSAEDRFAEAFGRPRRTFLVGWSLGHMVGSLMVRRFPDRYAGFLAVCGALAGGSLVDQRSIDARVLFDYFFPGAIATPVLETDMDFANEVLPAVVAAVTANPSAAIKLASIDQAYIRFNDPEELVGAIAGSLLVTSDAAQTRQTGVPFDNTRQVYTSAAMSAAELEALNAGVQRVRGDPSTLKTVKADDPDGSLPTRMLSLTTSRDMIVPPDLHVPLFKELVNARGSGENWLQRTVDGFGHCEFGFDAAPDPFFGVLVTAFDDLTTWATTGVKPSP